MRTREWPSTTQGFVRHIMGKKESAGERLRRLARQQMVRAERADEEAQRCRNRAASFMAKAAEAEGRAPEKLPTTGSLRQSRSFASKNALVAAAAKHGFTLASLACEMRRIGYEEGMPDLEHYHQSRLSLAYYGTRAISPNARRVVERLIGFKSWPER